MKVKSTIFGSNSEKINLNVIFCLGFQILQLNEIIEYF
jgi:hypothetical protein